jgi:hypothetical protein
MIATRAGDVLPDFRVWKKHGLNEAALLDPQVQRALRLIAVDQAKYFAHLKTMLTKHVDAATRLKGDNAIVAALPEPERERAKVWVGTSKWREMLSALRIEQKQLEREQEKRRDKLKRMGRGLSVNLDRET